MKLKSLIPLLEITSSDAWDKFYKNNPRFKLIEKDTFDLLNSLYPNGDIRFNRGTFEWLYQTLFINGEDSLDVNDIKERRQEIFDAMSLFMQKSSLLPQADRDLKNYTSFFNGDDSFINTVKQLSTLKSNREKDREELLNNSEKIYEDDMISIVKPYSKEAACILGKGTAWCTARNEEGKNMFHKYTDLWIFLDKKNKDHKNRQVKYQVGISVEQRVEVADAEDSPITLMELVDEYGDDWIQSLLDTSSKYSSTAVCNLILDTASDVTMDGMDFRFNELYELLVPDYIKSHNISYGVFRNIRNAEGGWYSVDTQLLVNAFIYDITEVDFDILNRLVESFKTEYGETSTLDAIFTALVREGYDFSDMFDSESEDSRPLALYDYLEEFQTIATPDILDKFSKDMGVDLDYLSNLKRDFAPFAMKTPINTPTSKTLQFIGLDPHNTSRDDWSTFDPDVAIYKVKYGNKTGTVSFNSIQRLLTNLDLFDNN
jgi:hypothetical protein